MAGPKNTVRGAPVRQKHWFFIGDRENAHRAQARAQFSKCAPRAGESSILSTQDGAHDHVSKQNEHRTEARATFCSKMSTPRRREHGGTSATGMPGSGGAPKTFVFHRKA